jgi:Ca2+-transporting ATPase
VRLGAQGLVMTVGSLVAYQIGAQTGDERVAATMLLTTLSLFHLAAGLLARDQVSTIFDRDAVPAAAQLRRYGLALLAILLVTMLDFLQRIFGTTGLSLAEWCACIGLAGSLVVVEEATKLVLRRRGKQAGSERPAPVLAPSH